MKNKINKALAICTIALSIILNSTVVNAQVQMKTLNKYGTNQAVLLGDKPVEIPNTIQTKEEEFRGTWISTVYNLDFPSKAGITQEQYKKEYLKVLENVEKLNLNAVIFQVRPKLDAFYQSDINPWSQYLTGTQGLSPGWDPLEWMIEETHKKGLEFHAWFNPYRVTTGSEPLSSLAPNNWARLNPQYTYSFGGKIYLNPGEPAVVEYINDSIMEVVENYNIDAVHFDDYFYPFRSKDNWYSQEEYNSYLKYGGGMMVDDWRRENVNTLVETLSNSIKSHNSNNKDNVQFGISPFAIWGHISNHPEGSSEGTGSRTPASSRGSYDDQFADTRKWVKNNWIDYIVPQVYWTFEETQASYEEVTDWWANVVSGTNVNLYIGHANYKQVDPTTKQQAWFNPEEIINQIKFNSTYNEIKGSVFFQYRSLLDENLKTEASKQFINVLKTEIYYEKTKTPTIGKTSGVEEQEIDENEETKVIKAPEKVNQIETSYGYIIIFEDSPENISQYYNIYRRLTESRKPTLIKTITRGNFDKFVYIDREVDQTMGNFIYSITAMDKNFNESNFIQE